jgi:hypothetical protein
MMIRRLGIYHHPDIPDIYRIAPIHLQDDLGCTVYLRLYILVVCFMPKTRYSKVTQNGRPECLRKTKLSGRIDSAIRSDDLRAWGLGFGSFKSCEYRFIFNL